jgi:hypothetical protein
MTRAALSARQKVFVWIAPTSGFSQTLRHKTKLARAGGASSLPQPVRRWCVRKTGSTIAPQNEECRCKEDCLVLRRKSKP